MKNLELFNISIEEFDKMNEKHTFSKRYNKNKKEILKNYRKRLFASYRGNYIKVAAAFAVILVSGSIIVKAATKEDKYSRIWGTLGRNDIESHDEVMYDGDTFYTVTYPKREYEDVDVEKAEELIGNEVTYPSITKEIDGTTITILSVVRDKNAAVMEFTLEKEGGVDVLHYSQLDNEAKGAWFSNEATFVFSTGHGSEFIYVDLDKSTNDKLYCYDYMTLKSESSYIPMKFIEYPCTCKELREADRIKSKEIFADTKTSTINIPTGGTVSSVKMRNTDGGVVEISPLSIKIDMNRGLGLNKQEACDARNCYYVSINYKDKTKYIVCDEEVENSSYVCGSLEGELTFVFNRLVDTSNILSVTVNNVEYTFD